MQWLNINTEFLHAPEFLGSEPVARATWLCVLGYCVMQENNGCIIDGAKWGDRMWQQACGVTLEEIRDTTLLIDICDEHVYVFAYPHDKQAEVQAKRIGGKAGGIKSGQQRRASRSASTRAGSIASPPASKECLQSPSRSSLRIAPQSVSQSDLNGREEKGMEENGREGNNRDQATPTPAPYYTMASFRCVIGFDNEQTETAELLIEKFTKSYLYDKIVIIRKRNKRNGKKSRAWLSDLLDEIQENPPQNEEARRAN